ncbi:MAG: hypothetical protein LCH88_08975 [Proteobacteria bacterium]|nr:hypothetical protein [Pseudomonadota bacterium]
MGKLTLDDIDNAEKSARRARVLLDEIGREIYEMREGAKLGPEYGFESYARANFQPEYYGEDGPDWGSGTPIFVLNYYWSRAESEQVVTFPAGWLEQDWRSLETARLAAERADEAKRKSDEDAQRARDAEAAELREYERLSAKFAAVKADKERG